MNNISALSGSVNTSYTKSGDMMEKVKASGNTIAEVTGRVCTGALDLYLTAEAPPGMISPLFGGIQFIYGIINSIHNVVEGPGDKITALKNAGDIVSGTGVMSGCMPATITGIAMTAIGTILNIATSSKSNEDKSMSGKKLMDQV